MLLIGHPLVGDPAYSGRRAGTIKILPDAAQLYLEDFKRQALHSHKIKLSHPVTGEEMAFASTLPDDMAKLVALLQG